MDKNDFGPEFRNELEKVSWFLKTLLWGTKYTFLIIAQKEFATRMLLPAEKERLIVADLQSKKKRKNVPIEIEKSRWLILPHGSFYPTFPAGTDRK